MKRPWMNLVIVLVLLLIVLGAYVNPQARSVVLKSREAQTTPPVQPAAPAALIPGVCAPQDDIEPLQYEIPSPALLSGTKPYMNTPGYWIGQLKHPDREVMGPQAIAAFNARIKTLVPLMQDLRTFPERISGRNVLDDIAWYFGAIKSMGLIGEDGSQPDEAWWQALRENLNLDAIPRRIAVDFGFVTQWSDQRILPHTRKLVRDEQSLSIDRFQFNALDIATPVAVLHRSKDGKWLYVAAPTSSAWVPIENVGFCSREAMRAYLEAKPFAVVTAAKADIFGDSALCIYEDRAQMGTRFQAQTTGDPGVIRIIVPVRSKNGECLWQAAYVHKSEASLGFLPYTQRTIINQAFKMLHTPYGWGGSFGEQDCSRLMQEIFATVGLHLPRNSTQQSFVGRLIYGGSGGTDRAGKLKILRKQAQAGLTLLRLDGHIMLYLGLVEKEPYVIHGMWGYQADLKTMCVVNRVVVSGLKLGNGELGTLLDRINTMRVLDSPLPQ